MANSPSFVQYALDLFAPLAQVDARRMFGGHGLYAEGLMFCLLDDGELFLKTDEEARPAFVAARCKAWVYPSPKGPMVTSYFQPPPAAMEGHEAMQPWYELAIGAARRNAVAKKKGKRRAGATAGAKVKAKAAPGAKVKAKAWAGQAAPKRGAKASRAKAAPQRRR